MSSQALEFHTSDCVPGINDPKKLLSEMKNDIRGALLCSI